MPQRRLPDGIGANGYTRFSGMQRLDRMSSGHIWRLSLAQAKHPFPDPCKPPDAPGPCSRLAKINAISASDDALTYPSPCWTIKNASKHWPWACNAATATPQLRNSLKGLFQPDSEVKQGRFCHSSILSLVPFHAHQGDGSDLFTASPLDGQRRRRVPWGLRRRRGRCCFAPLRRSLVRHEDANKRQVELVEEDHNSLISP